MKNRNRLYIVLLSLIIVSTLFLLNSLEKKEEKGLHLLSESNLMVKELTINILMLRRSEKDFLLRDDKKYISNFNENFIRLRSSIDSLLKDLNHETIDTKLLFEFDNSINTYTMSFMKLVEKKLIFGLNENDGIHFELRKITHKLLKNVELNKTLFSDVLQLRRIEKDFISRKSLKYKKAFIEKLDFILLNPNDEKIKKLLFEYKTNFILLTKIQEEIGLNENLGLMAEMRSAIHKSEDILEMLSKQLIEEIDTKSLELIRVTNMSIIGLFLIIMLIIIILVKFFINESKINELNLLNNELSKTLNNLEVTQTKLVEAEKMASLGGLVAGVAHEINTPIGIGLTGISHFLDMTKDVKEKYDSNTMSQDVFENYLNTSEELAIQINSNLQKTAHLVSNFKKISFDQSSEEKRKINLKEYLGEVIFSMKMITKKTNITIENRCPNDININTYPGAISQIITNLIINSIKHAFNEKEKGTIIIYATMKDGMVKLVYEDNGKGIEKDTLPKIFDPFFTTNREGGGTGLGLNILYNIISNTLLGKIKCNSIKGEGVEFTITFQESTKQEKLKKDNTWQI